MAVIKKRAEGENFYPRDSASDARKLEEIKRLSLRTSEIRSSYPNGEDIVLSDLGECFGCVIQAKKRGEDPVNVAWHVYPWQLTTDPSQFLIQVTKDFPDDPNITPVEREKQFQQALCEGTVFPMSKTEMMLPFRIIDLILEHVNEVKPEGSQVEASLLAGCKTRDDENSNKAFKLFKQELERRKTAGEIARVKTRGMTSESKNTRSSVVFVDGRHGRMYRMETLYDLEGSETKD